MRSSAVLFVLMIGLVGAGCTETSSSRPEPEEIRQAFSAFQGCVAEERFSPLLALVTADTLDRFAALRQQALYADRQALAIQDAVRQTWIFALRASQSPAKLAALSPEDVYLLLARQHVLFPVPKDIRDVSLGEIRVDGDRALADLQVKKFPVNVGPSLAARDYGYHTSLGKGEDVRFVKAEGGWRLDLGSFFDVTGLTLDLYFTDREEANLEQAIRYTGSLLNAALTDTILAAPLWTSPDTDAALAAYRAGDVGRAIALARAEAGKGYSKAYGILHTIYAADSESVADPVEAEQWLRKCIEALDGSMIRDYAIRVGRDPARGVTAAIPWWEKAAEAGNVPAMIYLGKTYRDGNGVPPDQEKARKWYSNCALLGGRGCYDAFMAL